MRKVILDLAVTLDGFIEGPNGEIDWCVLDEDMDFPDFLSGIDTIIYGRVSYDMWGNYQPDQHASEAEKLLWAAVHSKQKVVFSSQLRQDESRALFVTSDLPQQVAELKQLPGKDIWLYGGAKLITSFLHHNLIDIFRLAVHPTVLGSGNPLFPDLKERINLNLIEVSKFKSGVVQLVYEKNK
ncbi:dihydrofolate reductase [Pontibacter sp. Tf4]|uniref:dihydrofolate reductase family protein n=1 Tax=Pontibacter sp. Tf4 TaxID=2761620 RepID=UPI00162830E3|nr:dihydrofolate reductase family protein [Pontibacter sp. Tf4]MBB6611749.1 dihydrofolate reductase [Pontibacter sp. Tf4]